MVMQKKIGKTFVISFVFLMILPAILTSYVGATEAQKPSLSVGNYWAYGVEYLDPDSGIVTMNGTTTREIIGESNVTIDTELYECFVVKIEGSWQDATATVTWTLNGMIYLVKSDLCTVKEDMEITLIIGEEVTLNQISNVTYHSPLKECDFPLTEGKNWTVSTTKTETITYPGEPPDTKTTHVARNYTVGMTMDRVTVDAGTFDTFVIRYATSDSIYEQYYSSGAGGNVMELVYRRVDEQLTTRMELMETNFIAPSGPLEWWVWLAIAIIIVVAVGITYIFIIRMRKPSTPSGTAKMALAANFSSPSIF
ncbi:MAG: hypothetical protein HXX80_03180 [Nitrososphaerales archaeon]|nr:hypothetical protein [Nitrososphaerales archaeon]